MNLIESLKRYTTVVADTGDIDAIGEYRPQDATTNPSLLFQAAQKPQYQYLVDEALNFALKAGADQAARTAAFTDRLFVDFGCEILKIVPGRVSTEVDAGLSFDTAATLDKARKLIGMYQEAGIGRERILIKIASTWEGIRAAEQLRARRHSLQSDAAVQLRPGRRLCRGRRDAHLALRRPHLRLVQEERGGKDIPADDDPGVTSVTRIYDYFKKFDYKTQVMGASFRKVDQIVHLAGCDLLTISPDLLEQMEKTQGEVTRRLSAETARRSDGQKIHLDEKAFRWMHNEDAMATEKLAEGIRKFYADARKLEQFARARVTQKVAG